MHLDMALNNPDMFYHNFIANEAVTDYQIVSIDKMPFCSVYSFVCLNSDRGTEYANNFLKLYAENIVSERKNIDGDMFSKEFAKLTTLCPELNRLFFKEEWNAIKECNSIDDFKNYLRDNSGCCEEFDLYAKYQISQKENSFFEDYNTILTKYYKSVLFDIDELKKKCHVINGIQIMWNDMISDDQKVAIASILDGIENVGNDFVLYKPITKKHFHIITNNYSLNTLNRICDNLEEPAIVSYYDTEKFMESLHRLASIKPSLLSPGIIKLSLPIMSNSKMEQMDLLEWCKGDNGEEYASAIIYGSPGRNMQTEVRISKNAFGIFRITF